VTKNTEDDSKVKILSKAQFDELPRDDPRKMLAKVIGGLVSPAYVPYEMSRETAQRLLDGYNNKTNQTDDDPEKNATLKKEFTGEKQDWEL